METKLAAGQGSFWCQSHTIFFFLLGLYLEVLRLNLSLHSGNTPDRLWGMNLFVSGSAFNCVKGMRQSQGEPGLPEYLQLEESKLIQKRQVVVSSWETTGGVPYCSLLGLLCSSSGKDKVDRRLYLSTHNPNIGI